MKDKLSRLTVLNGKVMRPWCISLIVTAIVVPVSFQHFDWPIAIWGFQHFHGLKPLGNHLGSPLLVGGESLVALALAIYRILAGRLSDLAKITVIACATSLAVFALNEFVLKGLFGVPNPYEVFVQGAPHTLHLFQGSWQSSFPSGHMALAAGFVASFISQDRRLLTVLVAGSLLAAALLVGGSWHFLSDVIAGAFIGGTAGMIAASLWAQHQHITR